MFTRELSIKLLKIIEERDLTVKSLSELTRTSRNYMTNIISEKQTPTINILENICSGLEIEPNELLLSEKSMQPGKSVPLEVTKILCDKDRDNLFHIPICPSCNKPLIRDNQAYCDICGQRLSWHNYCHAEALYKLL